MLWARDIPPELHGRIEGVEAWRGFVEKGYSIGHPQDKMNCTVQDINNLFLITIRVFLFVLL